MPLTKGLEKRADGREFPFHLTVFLAVVWEHSKQGYQITSSGSFRGNCKDGKARRCTEKIMNSVAEEYIGQAKPKLRDDTFVYAVTFSLHIAHVAKDKQ